jgi:hypothetical protein
LPKSWEGGTKMIKEIFRRYTDVVTDIKESRLKAKTKLTEVSKSLIESDTKRLETEDAMIRIKEARKYKKKLKKTKLLSFLVFFGCIGSTMASLAGTGKLGDPITPELVALCFMLIFAQVVVFYGSIIATTVRRHYNKHYLSIKSIQVLMLIISIYFNYKFIRVYLDNSIVCLVLCILFDYSVIRYLNLIHDIRHDIKDEMQDNKNILQMLWYNMTYKFSQKIISDYNSNSKSEISNEISNNQELVTEISDTAKIEPFRLLESKSNNMESEISDDQKMEPEISNIILVKQKITQFESGARISVQTFKELGIDSKEWRKLRGELLKEKIIYTEASNTYKA